MRRLKFATRYFLTRLFKRPTLVNLEVTKTCNAFCSFCNYYLTPKNEKRLIDYSRIIQKVKPFVVSITGGEPLLRKDLEQIIKKIKKSHWGCYVGMITNGALLTKERARSLRNAGLDQISISLDFPDKRHDKSRGIPGLFNRIMKVIPYLKDMGFYRISFNTVITRENIKDLTRIADLALSLGINVSYSSYSSMKNGNLDLIPSNGFIDTLRDTIDKLIEHKKAYRNVMNSEYYLLKIPEYFGNGGIKGCLAGVKFIQVTPQGEIKRCAEFPAEYTIDTFPGKFEKTDCTECWYSCRGESEIPVDFRRIKDLWQ